MTGCRIVTLCVYTELTGCDMGRLGNWIFQIASTIGIVDVFLKKKAKPVIESSLPFLKVFRIDPTYISKFNLANVVLLTERDFKNYSLEKKVYCSRHNVSLQGYFQSWRYLSSVTSCVREILVINPSVLAKAKLIHAQGLFQLKTVIGIHIRRTDMLTKGSNSPAGIWWIFDGPGNWV